MRQRAAALALLFTTVAAVLASAVEAAPARAQQAMQPVPGVRGLSDVWCGADGVCLAVGVADAGANQTVGAVVVLRAVGPVGPVRVVPDTARLLDIDCPPTGSCMAVGADHIFDVTKVVEVRRDGTPGPARTLPGMTDAYDIACPTATTCLATGVRMTSLPTYPYFAMTPLFSVITNGQPAPPQRLPRGVWGDLGIDCPTATTCLVTESRGFVVLTNANGTWSSVYRGLSTPNVNPDDDISCGSSTTCYATAEAVEYSGNTFRILPAIIPVSAEGVAGPVLVLRDQPGAAHDVSCVFGRSCTVVGVDRVGSTTTVLRGWTIDLFRGTPSPPIFRPDGMGFVSVSCIAPATCGMVGGGPDGPVFAWHGPVPA